MITIREVAEQDETSWRRLWQKYIEFYEADIPKDVITYTWNALLDPRSAYLGFIAELNGVAAGISLSILHDGTWVKGKICYLEDLFVDEAHRGKGIARHLIQHLIDLGKTQGWERLYWHTKQDNPARHLYDSFTKVDDFVRYTLVL